MSSARLVYSLRPPVNGIDAISDLKHFAIITYAVDPQRLRPLIPECFELETIELNGKKQALLSVVPFLNTRFRSACWPGPRFVMGQCNYRVYIKTPQGQRAVWFLGTLLDSWTLFVPRYYWQMPWHSGQMRFDVTAQSYQLHTASHWGAQEIKLYPGQNTPEYPGFGQAQHGHHCLTHPLLGFYYRRDGRVGHYRIWHAPLSVTEAQVESIKISALERWGLVDLTAQQTPYSILLSPDCTFTIYLPPKSCAVADDAF